MTSSADHDPCKRQACDIQKCLSSHNFQESQCADTIMAMLKCCELHGNQVSVTCSGFQHVKWNPKSGFKHLTCDEEACRTDKKKIPM